MMFVYACGRCESLAPTHWCTAICKQQESTTQQTHDDTRRSAIRPYKCGWQPARKLLLTMQTWLLKASPLALALAQHL